MVEYFQTPPWMSGMLGAAISRRGENTRTIIWRDIFLGLQISCQDLLKQVLPKSLIT